MAESVTNNKIEQNKPAGLNSPLDEKLDNRIGEKRILKFDDVHDTAPGIQGFGNLCGGPTQFNGKYNYDKHHHHHH